jgi:hypothetical protein
MKLTTGRWTLWTDGTHPFAPENDSARRQLALELYAPKGGMTTWLYLIVEPSNGAEPLADEAVARTPHPTINSWLYSTHGDAPAPQRPEATTRTILTLREAGLRVPPGAMLRMGMGGELAALWAQASQDAEPVFDSVTLSREGAMRWAERAQYARSPAPTLVGAAWEEVGINLADVTTMAKILSVALAAPPRTVDGLREVVRSASLS